MDNAVLRLGQRRRRWANIETTLFHRVVLAGYVLQTTWWYNLLLNKHNGGFISGERRRRWPNINPVLVRRLVFTENRLCICGVICCTDVVLMLGQRRRRLANIKPYVAKRPLFSGNLTSNVNQPHPWVVTKGGWMMGQHHRRWPSIEPPLTQHLIFIHRYSVKRSDVTRWKQGYITPLPHTSFCETQWRHSVKTRLYKNPPLYFIVLASSVKTKEVEVIEFHRIIADVPKVGRRMKYR